MLSGSVTVSAGAMIDGRLVVKNTHEFKEGDAFAEVVNTWHMGVAGPKGAKILVWYTAKAGSPYTVKYAERPDYQIDRDRPDDSKCPVGDKASQAAEAPQSKNPRLEVPRSGHPTGLRPEVVNPLTPPTRTTR